MADLKADTQRLRDCANGLSRVYAEFTDHANPADGYDARELGSSKLLDVFNDFGDDWRIHREKLAAQIETLGKITESAADAYDGTDQALANALRKVDASYGGSNG
ncbi:MAG: hypothetical protein JO362_06230 [Streptomycetaceae bacterium]|nr:hypothetical protein [Streptomycetaceae bacterium]